MALKKIQVCKDDLQVAHNRIDAGTDILETILETLSKHEDVLVDCGLEELVTSANRSLELIETGRVIINDMLNGGK